MSADRVTAWLLSDDTGISSCTIVAAMTGSGIGRADVPHDPADFGRCYRLLKQMPEWRIGLTAVAQRFPKWGPMVAVWEELETLYERLLAAREAHGEVQWPGHGRRRPSAKAIAAYYAHPATVAYRALYERMRVLEDDGYAADGWTPTGGGGWRKGPAHAANLGGVTITTASPRP